MILFYSFLYTQTDSLHLSENTVSILLGKFCLLCRWFLVHLFRAILRLTNHPSVGYLCAYLNGTYNIILLRGFKTNEYV